MIRRLKKATPFVVSLTLHLALAIFLSFNLSGNGENSTEQQDEGNSNTPVEVTLQEEPKAAPKPLDGDIVPKQEDFPELEPPPLLQAESPVEVPEEKVEDAVTECQDDRWFGGIGIQQDWQTGRVDKVFPGYPADKAGLQVGDMIQRVDGVADSMGGKIRGTPGTTIVLEIFRPATMEYLTLTFKRDKICLGERR